MFLRYLCLYSFLLWRLRTRRLLKYFWRKGRGLMQDLLMRYGMDVNYGQRVLFVWYDLFAQNYILLYLFVCSLGFFLLNLFVSFLFACLFTSRSSPTYNKPQSCTALHIELIFLCNFILTFCFWIWIKTQIARKIALCNTTFNYSTFSLPSTTTGMLQRILSVSHLSCNSARNYLSHHPII